MATCLCSLEHLYFTVFRQEKGGGSLLTSAKQCLRSKDMDIDIYHLYNHILRDLIHLGSSF